MKTVSGMDLRQVLMNIRNVTQPCYGNPDPNAINDCWDEVFETVEKVDVLQKAFALACRLMSDNEFCPAEDGANFPECNDGMGKCSSKALWYCWQKYFTEKARNEDVCRVCGCTDDNACLGGCYWVEENLCSCCEVKE